MVHKFTVSDIIPASPKAIYDAWLDGGKHGQMTGAAATGAPKVGAAFTAWDGYVEGENLELDPPRRIVQSWRTSEFSEGDPDSKITVTLEAVDGGTRVTLLHTGIPDAHTGYKRGWHDSYFTPMKAYFAKANR